MKKKKLICFLTGLVMVFPLLPSVSAEDGDIVTVDSVPYVLTGENLIQYPDFADGEQRKASSQWYTGVNTGTAWDENVPDPKTGENLISLSSVCAFKEGEDSGSPAANTFYFGKDGGGTIDAAPRSGYYLCENITSAAGSYWNGKNSLLCFVPIDAGKTYCFSYNISSWGSVANSSLRYGAINSDEYCRLASEGRLSWSGSGGVNVDQYDGNNMTQKGSWAKYEGVFTAGEDADYFLFNLYWLQDTSYVCLNGLSLREAEPAEIIETEEVRVSAYAGTTPKLPSSVTVTYQNGQTGAAAAAWEESYDMRKDGVYQVNGVVTSGGKTYPISAELTVYSDSLYPEYTIAKAVSQKDGLITASFGIFGENTADVTCAAAVYDADGNIMSLQAQRGGGEIALSLPAPIYEGCYIKSYVWDKNLMPLTAVSKENISVQDGGEFVSVSDVTLLDGMFKTAQDLNVSYLLNIEPDRLLAPVLESAGMEAKASRYGGWESYNYNGWGGKGISGHSLGHWMSAASSSYQATGNTKLKEMLDYTVSELARVQRETGSGYIGGLVEEPFTQAFNGTVNTPDGFNLNGGWVPWYSVHKIYQGLIDAYVNTDNSQALEVVVRFADWAADGTEKMTDAQLQRMLNVEHGGMNEVFAQLYDITGNERYLNAAVRFTHNSVIEPLAEGRDELTGMHANTQIPKIIGAAAIYDEDESRADYRAASEFFWDTVVNSRSYVIGGNSVSEHFEAVGAETLHKKTCETCNTFNMIKLTEHLFSWNHDSSYMDFVENALYNDILGTQDPETGNKMYFTSLLQGHFRVYGTPEDSWWCCTGSGMENPGRYARCIYYKDKTELFVNLYIPSRMKWNETGLTLTAETDFPYSDKVKITVEGSGEATINLRVPSWINGSMTAAVNGGEALSASESGYLPVSRYWQSGDVIEITLPMALSVYTARDSENKVAFKYGPVVLGADMGESSRDIDTRKSETDIPDTTVSVPSLKTESANPEDFITPVDLSSLTFEIDGRYASDGGKITLTPFYSIHHSFHNVYWYLNAQADPYEKALNDITIDSLIPDGQQDEIGHSLTYENSHNGSFTSGITTYYWRDAYGDGEAYFSYAMKVDGANKNYLYASYWGSDGGFKSGGISYVRSFDIFVDGTKIAEQTLDSPSPGEPYNVFYEIPEELTSGKETVSVKFASKDEASCAGGILGLRTTSKNKVDIE